MTRAHRRSRTGHAGAVCPNCRRGTMRACSPGGERPWPDRGGRLYECDRCGNIYTRVELDERRKRRLEMLMATSNRRRRQRR